VSIANKTINSSLFILFIRGFHRSLGLISFVILARLLSPEDFGIVALATMLVFLCDVISESGAKQYLVQKETITDEDINTAWTLGLVLKSVLAVILVICAPFISIYFESPNLLLPLQVIALNLPFSALLSPGVYLHKRELNYKPIMKLEVYQKIISFVVSVCLAFYLMNYWAMIIGVVVSTCATVFFSYIFCPRKPKVTLINLTEQWAFSKWMLLKAIIGYIKSEIDTIFVSKLFSIETLGGFNMMKNLSSIPSREIIQPLSEPLLAAFSKVKLDKEKFNLQVLTSSALLLTLTLPCAAVLMMYSDEIVIVMLGGKWQSYSTILALLSFFILNFSIAAVFQQALISKEKVKFIFYYDLATFLCIILILSVFFQGDISDFALIRVCFAAFSILILILISWRILQFSLKKYVVLLLPILASTILAVQTIRIPAILDNIYLDLFLRLVVFVVAYGLSVIIFYFLCSKISVSVKIYTVWIIALLKEQLRRIPVFKKLH
jgi:lipopolysaccharide exporter